MSREKTRKFIGRAIMIDPLTHRDSACSAYVCTLLTDDRLRPSVTICQAPDVELLLAKIKESDLYAKFLEAGLTFKPPPGLYPISKTRRRQRYEELSATEMDIVQKALNVH